MQLSSEKRAPEPRDSFALLKELASTKRTGELVCASEASSVHIYLRQGRVAWGTDSESPQAFGRHVMRHCGLSRKQLGDLVRECRLSGLALGVGLAKSGLTTPAQVRRALQVQAEISVRALIARAGADCMFFDRTGFDAYPEDLTFSLDELLEPVDDKPSGLYRLTPHAAPERDVSAARRVFDEVRGCLWAAEIARGTCAQHHTVTSAMQGPPRSLVLALERQGLDFIGIQGEAGAVLGARCGAGDRSIWCGIREDALFGAAYTMLNQVCDTVATPIPSTRTTDPALIVVPDATTFCQKALALLASEPDALAACYLKGATPVGLVAREHTHQYADPAYLAACAALMFSGEVIASDAKDEQKMCVLALPSVWLFGVQLGSNPLESAWLVTSRRVPQGLGWARLGAML